jgi:hypothetical protein
MDIPTPVSAIIIVSAILFVGYLACGPAHDVVDVANGDFESARYEAGGFGVPSYWVVTFTDGRTFKCNPHPWSGAVPFRKNQRIHLFRRTFGEWEWST